MIFRKAESKDVYELAEIRWDFQYDPGEGSTEVSKDVFISYCAEFFHTGFKDGDWVCWLAEEGGTIISQVFIRRISKIPKPKKLYDEYGYVTNVFTRPEFRNRGIGKQLMANVIEWAANEDLQLLTVWPSQKSISFYKDVGFSAENEILELILRKDKFIKL